MKTYVTNLLFTIQPKLPHKKSNLNFAHKNNQCSTWPRRVEPTKNATFKHTYTYIYLLIYIDVRNMISFTLNNSVTNLTFTINSRGTKMKLRQPAYTTYNRSGFSATGTRSSHISVNFSPRKYGCLGWLMRCSTTSHEYRGRCGQQVGKGMTVMEGILGRARL